MPSVSAGQLGCEHVAVVAVGQREEPVGSFSAGAAQDALVSAVSTQRLASEFGIQSAEGISPDVEDGYLMAFGDQLARKACSDPAAADDDGAHPQSLLMVASRTSLCATGSRMTKTLHGALFNT